MVRIHGLHVEEGTDSTSVRYQATLRGRELYIKIGEELPYTIIKENDRTTIKVGDSEYVYEPGRYISRSKNLEVTQEPGCIRFHRLCNNLLPSEGADGLNG